MDDELQKIDLKITKAERLLPKEISELFIPSLEFDKIVIRDTVFLMGPKGSGKSMVLIDLSLPVQIERFKTKQSIEFDKSYVGIYVRCNEHHFGNEKEIVNEHGKPTEVWKRRFTHLFNLTVCGELILHLSKLKESPMIKIQPDEEKEICKEITEIFSLNSVSNFVELDKIIRAKLREIRKTSPNDMNLNECTSVSQLAEMQMLLQNNIKDFTEKMLAVLLDEYHELSDAQQKIISEILAVRKPIFKIASLPLGLTTTRETEEAFLDITQDYQSVNIGARNLTPGSSEQRDLKNFFIEMANKRLNEFGLKIEQLLDGEGPKPPAKIVKEKPDYTGLDSYVILSAGNAKTFLDLLNLTISNWSQKTIFIPRKIQQASIKSFAREQMDGIDFIPAISVYLFRALILKIGLLFQNYYRETGRSYLQIGIKDPEKLSKETIKTLSIAIKRSYLMAPAFERYSRDRIKLLSITLNNILLPYFDLPLTTHQVRELDAIEIEKLVDRRSSIDGKKIKFEEEQLKPVEASETLIPHLGIVDDIIDHIKNEELAIFIGSGLSTELGYPTGTELAKMIAEQFRIEYTGEDLPTIAERVIIKRGRPDLIKFIKKVLEESKKKESGSFSKLADFGVKDIFTTNWDNSIEDAFVAKSHKIHKIITDESISLASAGSTLIYKIHGDFDQPAMFVITDEDVLDEENTRPGIVNALKDIFLRKHFLFIGYSMADLDFKTIFYMIQKNQGKFKLKSYATVMHGPQEKLDVLNAKGIIPLKVRGDVLIGAIHDKLKEKKK